MESGHAGAVTFERDADLVSALTARAERLDELADTAELMGDEHTTRRLRRRAARDRDEALALLDDQP